MVKIMVNELKQNLAINLYLKKKNANLAKNPSFNFSINGYMAM